MNKYFKDFPRKNLTIVDLLQRADPHIHAKILYHHGNECQTVFDGELIDLKFTGPNRTLHEAALCPFDNIDIGLFGVLVIHTSDISCMSNYIKNASPVDTPKINTDCDQGEILHI